MEKVEVQKLILRELEMLWDAGECTRSNAVQAAEGVLSENGLTEKYTKVIIKSLGTSGGFTVKIEEE